jgi:hypothetical protein
VRLWLEPYGPLRGQTQRRRVMSMNNKQTALNILLNCPGNRNDKQADCGDAARTLHTMLQCRTTHIYPSTPLYAIHHISEPSRFYVGLSYIEFSLYL